MLENMSCMILNKIVQNFAKIYAFIFAKFRDIQIDFGKNFVFRGTHTYTEGCLKIS